MYQEGRHQGDPVTLGVGGFGRVVLVSPPSSFTLTAKYRDERAIKGIVVIFDKAQRTLKTLDLI